MLWSMLGALILLLSPALGYDALDDDESGAFTDDGEEEGDEANATPICSMGDTSHLYMEWDLSSSATLSLPPAGANNTWNLVYYVSGTDYSSGWTDLDQGDENNATNVVLSLPTAVLNAASTAPLAIDVRAHLESNSELLGVHHVNWLIVDNRGASVTYEDWDLHEWPTLGTGEPVADLDYETGTEILISGGSGPVSYITICVELTTSYADVGNVYVDGAPSRDHWNVGPDTPTEARGHWLFARGPSTSNLSTRLSDEATSTLPAGCGLLSLRRGETYDIWVQADVEVRDQDLTVRRVDANVPWIGIVKRSYVVPDEHIFSPPITFVKKQVHQAWNASAVASWALHRRKVGGFKNARLLTDEVGTNCGLGACAFGKKVYLGVPSLTPNGPVRTLKSRETSTVTHEMGHVVAYVINEKKVAAISYEVVGANLCRSPADGHSFASKEFSSAAAAEGFAHYYTALAFNDVRDDDCVIETQIGDFDSDLNPDLPATFGSFTAFSCNDLPYWGQGVYGNPAPPSADELGAVCDGVFPNRSTELDWLRFFWRLDTDQDLRFGKVLEVWDHANPHSWRKKDSGIQPYPWNRISGAGVGSGVGTEVAAEGSSNGIDRL